MDLIPILKKEHRQIIKYFEMFRSRKDEKNIKKNVKMLMVLLKFHLHKEDTLLYPALMKSKYPELRELGKTFSSIMLMYSKLIIPFLDEILKSKDDKLSGEQYNTFVGLMAKVTDRIYIEENVLFPAYQKIKEK